MADELRLHLGCGTVRLPGFTNIDCRKTAAVDVVDDIGSLPYYRPGTVDLIYCCHALDHFSRWDYMGVLRRWCELLKNGGVLRLSVVNFAEVVELYRERRNVTELIGLLHARQDYHSNVRKMSWDYASLSADLTKAGFSIVRPWQWQFTDHAGIDDCSQAYFPNRHANDARHISLNMEGVK